MKRLRKHIIATITIFTATFTLAILIAGAQTTNVSGNWKLNAQGRNLYSSTPAPYSGHCGRRVVFEAPVTRPRSAPS